MKCLAMYRWRDGRPAWDTAPPRDVASGWTGPSWDTRIGPSLDVTHTERGEVLGMAPSPPLLLEAVRSAPFPPAPGRLNLHYSNLGDEGARVLGSALQVLGGFPKLRLSAIGLSSCGISAAGFAYITRSLRRGFQGDGLRVLNVSGNCALGNEGIVLLGSVLPCTLQVLHFGGTGCGNEGMIAVCGALPPMSESLQTLSCINNPNIAEAGWLALGTALSHMRSLRSLQAEGCSGMGCAGAVALSLGIPRAPQLHLLNLHACAIGDEGACALASVLPLCRLTEVEEMLSQLLDEVQARIAADAAEQTRREAAAAAERAAEVTRQALAASRQRQADEELAASAQPQTSAWRRVLWAKGRRLFTKAGATPEQAQQLQIPPDGVWTEKNRVRVLDHSGAACWQCDGCGGWPDWSKHCVECVSTLDEAGNAWLQQQQSAEEAKAARGSRLEQLQPEPEPADVVDTAFRIRAAVDANLAHFEHWFGAFEDAQDKDDRGWETSVVLHPPPAPALAASASKTYPVRAQTTVFVAAHRRRPATSGSASDVDPGPSRQKETGTQQAQVDVCIDCGCTDFWAERLRTTLTSGAVWESTTYCFACVSEPRYRCFCFIACVRVLATSSCTGLNRQAYTTLTSGFAAG